MVRPLVPPTSYVKSTPKTSAPNEVSRDWMKWLKVMRMTNNSIAALLEALLERPSGKEVAKRNGIWLKIA